MQSKHFSDYCLLGYFQKKLKQGLRTWNFQGVLKKELWKFQESIKKVLQFPLVFKRDSCRISMGLGFWPWNFQGCHTILQNFQGWKLVFSRISKGKVTNLKIPGGFSRKVYPQSPLFGFFLEQPNVVYCIMTCTNHLGQMLHFPDNTNLLYINESMNKIPKNPHNNHDLSLIVQWMVVIS